MVCFLEKPVKSRQSGLTTPSSSPLSRQNAKKAEGTPNLLTGEIWFLKVVGEGGGGGRAVKNMLEPKCHVFLKCNFKMDGNNYIGTFM